MTTAANVDPRDAARRLAVRIPRLPPRARSTARLFVQQLGIKTPRSKPRVGNLSGGNQQKVALARWLAAKPAVLILDEPTQGVDVGAKAEIHRLMSELAGRGLAILMISSELPEILGMSDRIAVMHGGSDRRRPWTAHERRRRRSSSWRCVPGHRRRDERRSRAQ